MNGWNGANQSLPSEREYVQFILAGHRSLLYGVFTEHHFRSRWAAYLPQEVGVWRKISVAPLEPSPAPAAQERRYWSDRPMREA